MAYARSALLGSLFDQSNSETPLADEAHVFVAPKFAGGSEATSPIGGIGVDSIPQLAQTEPHQVVMLDKDVYIYGPIVNQWPANS